MAAASGDAAAKAASVDATPAEAAAAGAAAAEAYQGAVDAGKDATEAAAAAEEAAAVAFTPKPCPEKATHGSATVAGRLRAVQDALLNEEQDETTMVVTGRLTAFGHGVAKAARRRSRPSQRSLRAVQYQSLERAGSR